MGREYSQLGFEERVLIGHLHADGLSNGKIGARLGRSPSTIGRELRRGAKRQESYDPARADRRARQRRRAIPRFKLVRQPDLQDHVWQRLASPALSGWLASQPKGDSRPNKSPAG